jgi:hypothetical protein
VAGLSEIWIIAYEIRGKRVMLDSDLARLYQVETKALNQAVKRNIKRFPPDFMFQLTFEEVSSMRSQIVTAYQRNTSAPPFLRISLPIIYCFHIQDHNL